ncbi:MAG: glycoside hydrolase family 3 N-terminal domain-containing protein [Christensenellales bacterium]
MSGAKHDGCNHSRRAADNDRPCRNKTDRGFINAVKQYKIGNYILFSNNIESTDSSCVRNLNVHCRIRTGHIPFISADQEGGRVQRLPKNVIDTPSAREIAQSGNADEAFLTGKRIGEAMREMGLNYDLAPVVDVESVCGNPAIGSRSSARIRQRLRAPARRWRAGYRRRD